VKVKSGSGRYNGFVVVTVAEALLRGSIPVVESAKSCARRLYGDTWREERVTDQSPDG
jgi:hypothetical protein